MCLNTGFLVVGTILEGSGTSKRWSPTGESESLGLCPSTCDPQSNPFSLKLLHVKYLVTEVGSRTNADICYRGVEVSLPDHRVHRSSELVCGTSFGKCVVLWARQTLECCKETLMGHSGESMEASRTVSTLCILVSTFSVSS